MYLLWASVFRGFSIPEIPAFIAARNHVVYLSQKIILTESACHNLISVKLPAEPTSCILLRPPYRGAIYSWRYMAARGVTDYFQVLQNGQLSPLEVGKMFKQKVVIRVYRHAESQSGLNIGKRFKKMCMIMSKWRLVAEGWSTIVSYTLMFLFTDEMIRKFFPGTVVVKGERCEFWRQSSSDLTFVQCDHWIFDLIWLVWTLICRPIYLICCDEWSISWVIK